MPHTASNLAAATGVRVAYDGRVHRLRNDARTWDILLELEQLGAGEIVGIGSLTTALDAPHDGVTAQVIVSGRVRADGTGVIGLTPLAPGGGATITLTVRLAARVDGQEPTIAEVLGVEGLPG
jgi:hypothetical protein